MAALGELILLVIQAFLGCVSIIFLILIFTEQKNWKPFMMLLAFFFAFLLFGFRSCLQNRHLKEQQREVGKYALTNYPNCERCILELKSDLTYEIRNNGKIIKTGDWHYESGGDYWITYLNNDSDQLGSGDYQYNEFK